MLALLLLCAGGLAGGTELDPARSRGRFEAHLRLPMRAIGHLPEASGRIERDGERWRILVEIDARRLRMDGPAWMAHVTRSPGFLDVERHPRIAFRSDPFAPTLLERGGVIAGELSLRGQSRRERLHLIAADCPRPGIDCDLVVYGQVNRYDFGMDGHRLSVRPDVDIEFRLRWREAP